MDDVVDDGRRLGSEIHRCRTGMDVRLMAHDRPRGEQPHHEHDERRGDDDQAESSRCRSLPQARTRPVASPRMLDHVFTDAIGALRETLETAFLERQRRRGAVPGRRAARRRHVGDVRTGCPARALPPRVVADITFDWPTWAQTAYRLWYRTSRSTSRPASRSRSCCGSSGSRRTRTRSSCSPSCPTQSPPIGTSAPLERFGPTVETLYREPLEEPGVRDRGVLRGHLRADRGAARRRLDPRRPLQRDGRLDRVDARAARRPASSSSCPPTRKRCCHDRRPGAARGQRSHRHGHAQPARRPQRAVLRGAAAAARRCSARPTGVTTST